MRRLAALIISVATAQPVQNYYGNAGGAQREGFIFDKKCVFSRRHDKQVFSYDQNYNCPLGGGWQQNKSFDGGNKGKGKQKDSGRADGGTGGT